MRKLFLIPILFSVLLLAACSDDDDGGSVAAQSATGATAASADAQVVEGTLKVDFTGAPEELEPIDLPFSVPAGSTAWDAIKAALGEENVSTQDFGGDLGTFITGFRGVVVEGNHFWEFRVNGEGSNVGVSQYKVKAGDVLEFVYSSF